MTAGELIEELRAVPPDTPVVILDADTTWYLRDIEAPSIETIAGASTLVLSATYEDVVRHGAAKHG